MSHVLHRAMLALWLLPALACSAGEGLQPLSEDDLAGVRGQAGITMDFEWRLNADASGNPVACPTVGSATDCRLGLSFAERQGMWIVLKGYRGILRLRNIRIDAANLNPGWTTHTNAGAAQSPYLAGYDPRGKPAIQLTAGNWATALAGGATAYNTYLNSNVYSELTTSLNISQVTAEYNCAAAVNNSTGMHVGGCSAATAGWDDSFTPDSLDHVPGYLRSSVGGSAISLRMADGTTNPNAPAQFRLDGRLQIFGY